MRNPPRVALLIDTSFVYGRGILTGISRYLHSHKPWQSFVLNGDLRANPWDLLNSNHWDGILTRYNDPALARTFQSMNIPVVDMDDFGENPDFLWIGSNHAAIGRSGAVHFLERGFRHFGFRGAGGILWSCQRLNGFRAAIEQRGYRVEVNDAAWKPAGHTEDDFAALVEWVKALPKPVAIMACNDVLALDVVSACHEAGLMVPEEVAAIGVDNGELLCDFCEPPLSSVAPDTEQIGYRAAELLDAMMAGSTTSPPRRIMIEPLPVVTRQSTEVFAVTDWLVAAGLRFIRENALRGCSVPDVLDHLRVSRGALESRFRKALNRSVKEEILRIQINRIKQLLVETDFTLEHIAELVGFEHPEYMSVLFKRKLGPTPGEYRNRFPKTACGNVLPDESGIYQRAGLSTPNHAMIPTSTSEIPIPKTIGTRRRRKITGITPITSHRTAFTMAKCGNPSLSLASRPNPDTSITNNASP